MHEAWGTPLAELLKACGPTVDPWNRPTDRQPTRQRAVETLSLCKEEGNMETSLIPVLCGVVVAVLDIFWWLR